MAHPKAGSIRTKKDREIRVVDANPSPRTLPAMPIQIDYYPSDVVTSYEKQGEEIVFRYRAAEPPRWGPLHTLDAFAFRTTFLEVKTPGEAVDLLNVSGFFRFGRSEAIADPYRFTMSWKEFRGWQELMRLVLTNGFPRYKEVSRTSKGIIVQLNVPEEFRRQVSDASLRENTLMTGAPPEITIQAQETSRKSQERSKLVATIQADSALEAILATIYLDNLSGIDYRLCNLKDCSKIYEVSSNHKRQYCSQYCAHKASVRRRRALKVERA